MPSQKGHACMTIGAMVSATALSFALFSIWQNMLAITECCFSISMHNIIIYIWSRLLS